MLTATFSNGFTDTYKGDRDVRAAWMVILPNGKVMSGHSRDVATARKTAENNIPFHGGDRFHYQSLKAMAKWAHMQVQVRKILKETGFKSVREHDAARSAARAAFVAQCKIEVVAL